MTDIRDAVKMIREMGLKVIIEDRIIEGCHISRDEGNFIVSITSPNIFIHDDKMIVKPEGWRDLAMIAEEVKKMVESIEALHSAYGEISEDNTKECMV